MKIKKFLSSLASIFSASNKTMDIVLFYRSSGDINIVQILVGALRAVYQSEVDIIFLTDKNTECPIGIDECIRYDFTSTSLMKSRIEAYASYEPIRPSIYLDSDILPSSKIDQPFLATLRGSYVFCKRYYGLNNPFNPNFRGVEYTKYSGQTAGEAYPILASFSYAENNKFWRQCLKEFSSLDQSFYKWYGDQEVIKIVTAKGIFNNIKFVSEQIVSKLPEDKSNAKSFFLHFKGNRKKLMAEYFHKLINQVQE